MELKELTKNLCSLPGLSGFEGAVYEYVADYVRPFADEVTTDVMGNLLAVRRCGRPEAKTVLLDAHMDEVGLIVTAVENGFLRFSAVGGIDARILPALEVRVLTENGPLFGVIDTMPPHALGPSDSDKAVDIDKLYIDVGLTQEEAEARVPVGTPVVYGVGCGELGSDRLCGKSLDDRACAAIQIKAFEDLADEKLNVDLALMISTQEEVGGRGAMTGAWRIDPDYAVVSDVTFDRGTDGDSVTTKLGKGAAIGVGPNMHHAMTQEMIRLAKERGIPHQIEVCPGRSGTNAEEIQVSRLGVATLLVSLPLRYMHTPHEVVCCGDMESVRRLIAEYVLSLEG